MGTPTSPSRPVENGELIASETTALLASFEATVATTDQTSGDVARSTLPASPKTLEDDDVPLPKVQILLLCYARLFEPIVFFCIFPFINQMIWETGTVAKTDVGFYSGLIESLFSMTQMVFMIPWGRLADHPKVGRKPVLVFSLVGVAISIALFGLSKSIWQMILFRCLGGIFAGTVVTMRTMFSEISTPKTQARAFSFFAFTGNVGIFLGPLIGGALSNPAHEYPRFFGHIQFFKDYPYSLPTLTAGAIGLSAALVSALFLEETLKTKDSNADPSRNKEARMSTWEIFKAPGVGMVLLIYVYVMMLAFAYTAVITVFWFTPIELSGFNFSPLQISIFLGVTGVSQAIWLLLAFPYLQRRFSTGGVLRGCGIAYPVFFLMWPLCSIFLRLGWKVAFWALAPTTVVLGSGVAMSFTAVQLAINDISPSSTTLGTLNALALTLSSGVRAFSPALFAAIFATGVRYQIVGGYLVWVVMIVLSFGYTVLARYLPAKAEGRLKESGTDDAA